MLRHGDCPNRCRGRRLQQAHSEVGGAAGLAAQKLGRHQLHGVAEAAGEVGAVGLGFGAGLGRLLIAGTGIVAAGFENGVQADV